MCLHCVLLSEDKTLSLLQNSSKRYESILLFKVRGTFSCVLFSWMRESYSGPPLSFGILLLLLSGIVVALVPTDWVFVLQQALQFLAPRPSDHAPFSFRSTKERRKFNAWLLDESSLKRPRWQCRTKNRNLHQHDFYYTRWLIYKFCICILDIYVYDWVTRFGSD